MIEGIEGSDAACRLIGIEFIEEDQGFAFGAILKSNTARALRRSQLSDGDRERIRRRVVSMLTRGVVPHEYKEYAKLLKGIGLGNYRRDIEACVGAAHPYVAKFARYFLSP